MTAIFAGLGAGFAHGSRASLGSNGLLGQAALGRAGEGVYLNAQTGNLVLTQQDEFVAGLGPDLAIARTYNSIAAQADDNGDRWRQSTDRRLDFNGTTAGADGSITRTAADGSTVTWTWNATASAYLTSDLAGEDQTVVYAAGAWTWRDNRNHVSETYTGSTGTIFISAQADADGNQLTYSYVSGKLDKITTKNGDYVQYTWVGNDITDIVTHYTDLPTSTAKTLTRTRYGYDASHRLTSVTVDLSPEDNSIADGKVYTTTYTYVGATNLIASIEQSDHSRVDFHYDGSNRIDRIEQKVSATDIRRTEISYSAGGDYADFETYTQDYVDASTPSLTTRVSFAVSVSGLFGDLTQVKQPAPTGGASQPTWNYTYDNAGRVLSATDPLGAVTSYTYDSNGNVATITDRNNNVTSRFYDSNNNLIRETRTGSTAASSGTSLHTRFVYDSENHLRFVISAEGRVSERRYDADGNLTAAIDYPDFAYAIGSTTQSEGDLTSWLSTKDKTNAEICMYAYDGRGNLVQATHYGAATNAGIAQTTEGYAQTATIYDQAGRLIQRTTGPLATETFVYDGLGRLIASTDLTGGKTALVFLDSADQTEVVTLAANNAGDATSNSYLAVSTYNWAGELINKTDNIGSVGANVWTVTGTETFGYDKLGQLRKSTDATGYNSYVLYDDDGHKVADIGNGGQIVEYRYDLDGRLVATVRYENQLTSTQLTSLASPTNQVTLASIRPAANAADIWQWNVYDAGGRVIESIMGDGSAAKYEYDASDRLVKTTAYYNKLTSTQVTGFMTTAPTALTLPAADSAHDAVTRSFYDGDGRLVGTLNAQNFVTQVVYDSAGRKVQTIAYANATTASAPATDVFTVILPTADPNKDISTRYVYDGQGLLRYTIDAFRHVTELVYRQNDDNYAIGPVRKTIEHATALGSVADYNYVTIKNAVATNAADRVSYAVYNGQGQLGYSIDATGVVTAFAYDGMGRTIKATQFATQMDASDADAPWTSGNTDAAWLSKLNHWVSLHSVAATDRISRTYYGERGEVRFSIDAEGYVTRDDQDAEGRLYTRSRYSTAVSATDGWTIADVANANKGSAVTNQYRYDGLGRLQDVYDANGKRHTTFYHGNGQISYQIEGYAQGADEGRTFYAYDQAGRLTDVSRYNSEAANAGSVGATATQLTQAQKLESANGLYKLVLTREGELRLYNNGDLIWTNGVREVVTGATYRLVAQTDGHLVIYRDVSGQSSVAIWNVSGSAYSGAAFMVLQNDGNFIFAQGTAPTSQGTIWQSATANWTTSNPDAAWSEYTHYNYDGLGNQTSIVDFRGNTTSFTYDKLGRVLTRTDALSGVTQYQYDAFGDVVKTIDARNNAAFAYYDQAGRQVLAVDAETYATRTTYSAFGEALSVLRYATKVSGTPVVGTQPTTPTNAADETTNFVYDKLGRLIQTTDAAGGVEDYAYTAFGQRKSFTNKGNGTARATINYTYDRRGLLKSETLPIEARNPDGTLEAASVTNSYTYDSRGNRITMTEAAGLNEERVTSYQYDAADRLTDVIGEAVLVTSSATSGTTNSSPTTHYDYDRRGNVIAVTAPDGGKTFSWYDKLDRLIEQVSPLGTVTTFFYDKNSNLTEKRVYATQMTPLPTDANGPPPPPTGTYRTTKYVYDALNRVTQVKIPSTKIASYSSTLAVTTQDLVTTTLYDAMGNVLKVTDANGAATWSYYDKLGRKTAQIDALNYRTDWTYSADGNVTSETRYANAGTSAGSSVPVTPGVLPANLPTLDAANDRVTTFTYDKMGRRLTETRVGVVVHNAASPGTTQTVNATVTYTYNALGNVTSKSEATGEAISYAYDASGRMTSETHASFTGYTTSGTHSVTPVTSYSYDGLNDLVRTVQTGDAAANAADRITKYQYGAGGRLTWMEDAESFRHTYQYDKAGRVTRDEYVRQLPNGSTSHEAIGSDYDAEGRVVRQGALVDLDTSSNDNWSRDGAAIDTQATQYNAFGEVSKRGYAHYTGGVETTLYGEEFFYDAAGRLQRTSAGDGVWKYFMYDAAGNQTLMIATVGADFGAAALDTLDEVLALWTGGPATIATTNVADVTATITQYDARNQAVLVLEPKRDVFVDVSGVPTLTPSDLTTTRAYTAFGEVAYEINATGARVDYAYNTMGRLIQTTSPAVSITAENGAVTTNYRPVEKRYYDVSGRLVAQRDANDNLTKYTLLAGTGYGDSQALITQTINPDDNDVIRTYYDIHGDERRIEDPLYLSSAPTLHVTTQTFDKMGRLVQMTRAASLTQSLTDYYRYDGLGQRIRHFNSFYNASYNPAADPTGASAVNAETTAYDLQGRVTKTVAAGGDATNYAYAWDGTLVTNGMNTSANPFGGWVNTTTFANGKVLTAKIDVFGHDVVKIDMSAHTTNFTYDKAGRLIQRDATFNGAAWGNTLYQNYFNTGRLKAIFQLTDTRPVLDPPPGSDPGGGGGGPGGGGGGGEENFAMVDLSPVTELVYAPGYRGSEFGYDKLGNVVFQNLRQDVSDIISSQTASYDALGRIVSWSEAGSSVGLPFYTTLGAARHDFEYDANGNIRRSLAHYHALSDQGVISTTETTQDYWYRYDAMNRMVTSKGAWNPQAGAIQRGSAGIDTFYNADGSRAYTLQGSNWREDYVYDAVGRVVQVKGGNNLSAPGMLRGAFTYDALGRTLRQIDYIGTSGYLEFINGISNPDPELAGAVLSRTVVYNAKNQVVSEDRYEHRNDDIYRYQSTYSYGDIFYNVDGSVNTATTTYALGEAIQVDTLQTKDGGAWPTTRTINTFNWYEGAVAASVQYDGDVNNATNTPWTTTYIYDTVGGQMLLEKAEIRDGRPRNVVWINDMLGQVVRRDERDGNTSGGDPHEEWHRLSGRQMGYVGMSVNNDVNYAQSVSNRAFGAGPSANADFDLAYDNITTFEQGSMGGLYTVHGGDTLQSIAANLWGDASLWWKIADVNGLSGQSMLTEGQSILIPVGVQRNENNATTFQPYDPLEVLGNTSPTSPKPPKNKCGAMGAVLMAIVAIVVVAIVAPYATAWASNVFGGATVTATGAAATTGATVGMSAGASISGVTAGMVSAGTVAAGTTASVVGGAIAGAAGSIVSQGIGVASGIQEKFSWNAVALATINGALNGAAGAGSKLGIGGDSMRSAMLRAGVVSAATQGLGMALGLQKDFSWAGVAAAAAAPWLSAKVNGALPANVGDTTALVAQNSASLIVNAAMRSLIDGGDFGDNVMAALPDVIGQTIGEAIAGGISGNGGGSGESIFDEIGHGLAAVGDFLGFDGQFGYQGPEARNVSLAGLENAIERALTPPPSASSETSPAETGLAQHRLSAYAAGKLVISADGSPVASKQKVIGAFAANVGGTEQNEEISPTQVTGAVYGGTLDGEFVEIQGVRYRVSLILHETVGGHTISQHVARSDRWLRGRLRREPEIPAASTFPSIGAAERVVNTVLSSPEGQVIINRLMADRNGAGVATLEATFDRPVGTTVIRGANAGVPAYNVFILVQRPALTPEGFLIITAYPF